MAAVNGAKVFQAQALANQRVDRHLCVIQAEAVLHHRCLQAYRHLAQRATCEFDQCTESDLNRMLAMGADFDAHS
ncbi:hypothetical protein D9M71_780000 [compost metagenome]